MVPIVDPIVKYDPDGPFHVVPGECLAARAMQGANRSAEAPTVVSALVSVQLQNVPEATVVRVV